MQLLAKNMAAHMYTPFAYAIITKTSYAFFAKITLCIFYPMTPVAHAFAYAIKKTPYAFFAKITLCMYILCANFFKNNLRYRSKEWKYHFHQYLYNVVMYLNNCNRGTGIIWSYFNDFKQCSTKKLLRILPNS